MRSINRENVNGGVYAVVAVQKQDRQILQEVLAYFGIEPFHSQYHSQWDHRNNPLASSEVDRKERDTIYTWDASLN